MSNLEIINMCEIIVINMEESKKTLFRIFREREQGYGS
jgi:hypothetical protein